jgi:hypothetical protein
MILDNTDYISYTEVSVLTGLTQCSHSHNTKQNSVTCTAVNHAIVNTQGLLLQLKSLIPENGPCARLAQSNPHSCKPYPSHT